MNFVDDLIRGWLLRQPGHEGTREGVWMCGECPYMNHGSICTKCGGPVGAARWWQS